ncbi:hypothetical protein MLD38_028312 [Melastoma candidum]|uniref:Uncharacterized protein n=1 Tax=Melastoma candidum TaxID=119954 RepID=A0ACB9N286_9MYRT|nr:hypothetical protein MLD38_028312 [Melastoma candidum]
MWMMGYTDGGENIYTPTTTATTTTTNNESFSGSRKLRPLIPRPPPSQPQPQPQPHQHHGRGSGGVHNANHFLVLNHHLVAMAEQGKRELNNAAAQQVVVSSRWNPTPEQLGTLEDLWRRGTRTPSADEIQQITSRLRRYGKIEGKNVFYWFQNHKARERQKRCRKMESGGCQDEENDHAGGLNEQPESGNLGNKEAGGRSSKTSSDDVRRSNNNNSNSNWESATDKEGKLMASVGGGGGSGCASLFVAASASSSSVVRSPLLWMKTSSDNNSVPSGEPLLHWPNSNAFCLSGGCCCRSDDNDGNANVNNVPLEWRNAAWHPHLSSAPGPCRPLLLPPFPATAGHLTMRVCPDMTASHSSSPASSSQLTNPDFPTLQLFPLRSNCDQEEDYLEGCRRARQEDPCDIGTAMDEFAGTDNVDRHQFFEFLPLKN